eukprot:s2256_g4.t1
MLWHAVMQHSRKCASFQYHLLLNYCEQVRCRGKLFEVHDFGDKGMGVVAARDIQKGELLLREQPLFLVSQCRDSRQLDAWENEINAALRKLPEHDLQSFWSLAESCLVPVAFLCTCIWSSNILAALASQTEVSSDTEAELRAKALLEGL